MAKKIGDNNPNFLVGTINADPFYGFAGNDKDLVNARPNNDLVYGDNREDLLQGEAGNDRIFGGEDSTYDRTENSHEFYLDKLDF